MKPEQNILVSVITPSYNQGHFIEATIKSVLNQTYRNIQYIIIDGGSTDNTMDVIGKYRNQIDIIVHEKDKGQSDAINKGFRLSKGQLVGWINSDDILYPDCVENIVTLYQKHPAGSIYYSSRINFIDTNGNLKEVCQLNIKDKHHLINTDFKINQPGSFYNNEMLRQINYLDEKIHYCMDLDLFIRLLDKGPIFSFDKKPLAGFRIWENSKTSTGNEKFIKDIRRTIRKYGASPFAKAMRLTYYDELRIRIKKLLSI